MHVHYLRLSRISWCVWGRLNYQSATIAWYWRCWRGDDGGHIAYSVRYRLESAGGTWTSECASLTLGSRAKACPRSLHDLCKAMSNPWPVDERTPPAVALRELAMQIRDKCAGTPDLTALSDSIVLTVYLAGIFAEEVYRNGFMGLIQSLAGDYLPEMEDSLIALGAKSAQLAYCEAFNLCLADIDGYHELMNDQFTDNKLAVELLQVSAIYFNNGADFYTEISQELKSMLPHVVKWISEAHLMPETNK